MLFYFFVSFALCPPCVRICIEFNHHWMVWDWIYTWKFCVCWRRVKCKRFSFFNFFLLFKWTMVQVVKWLQKMQCDNNILSFVKPRSKKENYYERRKQYEEYDEGKYLAAGLLSPILTWDIRLLQNLSSVIISLLGNDTLWHRSSTKAIDNKQPLFTEGHFVPLLLYSLSYRFVM